MAYIQRRELLFAGVSLTAAAAFDSVWASMLTPAGNFGTPTSAYKMIGFLKRHPQLTHAAFVKQWKSKHAPLFASTPGLTHYVLDVMEPDDKNPYDGAAELWWEDEAAAKASIGRKGPEAEALSVESKTLLDAQGSIEFSVASREIVVQSPPTDANRPQFKMFYLIKRVPGMSDEDFAVAWRDKHAKFVAADPIMNAGVEGYTINIIDHHADFSRPTSWDGYATLWYRDAASYQRVAGAVQDRIRDALASAGKSGQPFFFPDTQQVLIKEEVIVK